MLDAQRVDAFNAVFASHPCSSALRELKRLEAIAASPIFAEFSSSLAGLTSIRAAGLRDYVVRAVQLMSCYHRQGHPRPCAVREVSGAGALSLRCPAQISLRSSY